MDFGSTILLMLVACLGLGLLVHTKFIQPKNAALSEEGLKEEGFEYIFVDDYYDFFAFDGVEQIRLGSLLSAEFYGCSVDAIRDSRWEWTDDGRDRYDRFIIHIGDPNRPMHVLKYKNKKEKAEREWARLDVILSHARYVFEQSVNQDLEGAREDGNITVLFLSSNPLDQTYLRLDEEVRSIEEKLRASEYRDSVRLVSGWATRPADLLRAVNEHCPTVVHFSGHGSSSDELVLQDEDGNAKCVSKAALTEFFRIQSGSIKLVVFNACFTSVQASEITEHIPFAIGMKSAIGDEAARIFAANFYQAIGYGKSIQESFAQGRASLMLESIPEEDAPQLFSRLGMNAEEISLVNPASRAESKNARSQNEPVN